MTRELTTEEVENLQKYGLCRVCGLPRYPKTHRVSQDVWEIILSCPNDHPQ